MGDLSRSLSRYEIACPDGCGEDSHDPEQVAILQKTVDHFQILYPEMNVGIHITSGNRCYTYNSNTEGASDTSKHVKNMADDFFLYDKDTGNYINGKRIHEDEVADYLEKEYPDKYGIGRYNGRTHLDCRPWKARWDMR